MTVRVTADAPVRTKEYVNTELGNLKAEVGHGRDEVLIALEERRLEVLAQVPNRDRSVGTHGRHAVTRAAMLPLKNTRPPGARRGVPSIVQATFPQDGEVRPEEDVDLKAEYEYM